MPNNGETLEILRREATDLIFILKNKLIDSNLDNVVGGMVVPIMILPTIS